MIARSPMFVRAALLLLAASCVEACGSQGSASALKQVSSAISGGEPDSVDSNVFILVSHRQKEGVALCSASLIAPNLLLTARHCVADVTSETVTCGVTTAGTPFPANTFFAANTQSIDQVTMANAFAVSAVSVPTQGSDICGFDLALVTLSTLVPASIATPLIPRIDRKVTLGEAYTAVGYGQDLPGDAGIAGAGARRGRSGLKVECAPGGCGAGVQSDEFGGNEGICSGDSGGPALDADGKVVGVVSRSGDSCNHPVYGSVASWKDWITTTTRQAALDGKYDVPFWVDSGSSDSPNPSTTSPGDDAGSGTAGASATTPGEPEAAAGAADGALNPAESGTQGDKCAATPDCHNGFGCYSPTSTSDNAYCALLCTSQAQCMSGTHCDNGVGACIEPIKVSSAESSSCAVSSVGRVGGVGNGGLALLGVALGLVGRKRRHRARARKGAGAPERREPRSTH
jgi:MYXO-CTERM domain-containing protein